MRGVRHNLGCLPCSSLLKNDLGGDGRGGHTHNFPCQFDEAKDPSVVLSRQVSQPASDTMSSNGLYASSVKDQHYVHTYTGES